MRDEITYERRISTILFLAITLSVTFSFALFRAYGSRPFESHGLIRTRWLYEILVLCFFFFLIGVAIKSRLPRMRRLLAVWGGWSALLAVQLLYSAFSLHSVLIMGAVLELLAVIVFAFAKRSPDSG